MHSRRDLLVCAAALAGCAPRLARLKEPSLAARRSPEVWKARFQTTQGNFVVQVVRPWAPLGADRFYNLVKGGFYDGCRFFRALPGFVVQWGINPDPAVSKAWGDKTKIQDDPVKASNVRGTVSFATDGPNTRTVQVYINLGANSRLDVRGFSAFGRVTEGMDVVEKLYAGYGEGAPRGKGPDQDRIEKEGEAYLAREFPKLDRTIRARVVR
ncbi:MAG TPA: peptidylprolyl isomerase [Bryobacteraceae bacterium]|nr:peptidylprolyl isomerase [Bryobacteraceae bacterium]